MNYRACSHSSHLRAVAANVHCHMVNVKPQDSKVLACNSVGWNVAQVKRVTAERVRVAAGRLAALDRPQAVRRIARKLCAGSPASRPS
jgi:hypothetical protein